MIVETAGDILVQQRQLAGGGRGVAVAVDAGGGSVTVRVCVAECEVTPATVSFAVICSVATGCLAPS